MDLRMHSYYNQSMYQSRLDYQVWYLWHLELAAVVYVYEQADRHRLLEILI